MAFQSLCFLIDSLSYTTFFTAPLSYKTHSRLPLLLVLIAPPLLLSGFCSCLPLYPSTSSFFFPEHLGLSDSNHLSFSSATVYNSQSRFLSQLGTIEHEPEWNWQGDAGYRSQDATCRARPRLRQKRTRAQWKSKSE